MTLVASEGFATLRLHPALIRIAMVTASVTHQLRCTIDLDDRDLAAHCILSFGIPGVRTLSICTRNFRTLSVPNFRIPSFRISNVRTINFRSCRDARALDAARVRTLSLRVLFRILSFRTPAFGSSTFEP